MDKTSIEMRERLVDFHVEDASERLRFQQEFSVAGFKSLILINGGAVVGLLTYAGNASDRVVAANFEWAFGGYISGLIFAVLAYLPAYLGQALIMQFSAAEAFQAMDVQKNDQAVQDRRVRWSNIWIGVAMALCLLSMFSFVVGSLGAIRGLS